MPARATATALHRATLRGRHRLVVVGTCAALLFPIAVGAAGSDEARNADQWPVFQDHGFGYSISHPPDWKLAPSNAPDVRFSVVPPNPPGNCSLVASKKDALAAMDQAALNSEVLRSGLGREDWASYLGVPPANVRVVNARRATVNDVSAVVGVVVTEFRNRQGTFMRKQIAALMLSRGAIWTLNCGVSDANRAAAQTRYDALAPAFSRILGSFAFAATAATASPAQVQAQAPVAALNAAQIEQIEQIEQIARNVAAQFNAKKVANDMTVSSRAVAVGRNVRLAYVVRIAKGLPPAKIQAFSDAIQREVVPGSCTTNAQNPAFARGLSYTFAYSNAFGEKLAEFTVDHALCQRLVSSSGARPTD